MCIKYENFVEKVYNKMLTMKNKEKPLFLYFFYSDNHVDNYVDKVDKCLKNKVDKPFLSG